MEIRDNLCDLGRMEIPRPQFHGMQFVATRGKLGFYKTIRENGGKYGIQVKSQGPRRPALSNDIFVRPPPVSMEERPRMPRSKPNEEKSSREAQIKVLRRFSAPQLWFPCCY
ncbi:hypothetical protein Y032_0594g423 [Ancylostoma ceylanicum]|uniref:Uncharacterized protein n=1 Tax=Ancylostoma ceylanicum TaxID=53326 RepID=A0A016WNJ2_9BILA|nr:hypothetical protein Y032_0594g423 [Ancylostoma ceylanicum]